jgi:hypothetical protein
MDWRALALPLSLGPGEGEGLGRRLMRVEYNLDETSGPAGLAKNKEVGAKVRAVLSVTSHTILYVTHHKLPCQCILG